MNKFEWDINSDGAVSFVPYVGHQTATMSDQICLLRLAFVSSPDQRDEDAHAVQLALSRDQVRRLGQDLLRLAEAPHIPRPLTDSQH